MQGRGKPLEMLCLFSRSCISRIFKAEIEYVRVAQRMSHLENFYLYKLHGRSVPRLNVRKL